MNAEPSVSRVTAAVVVLVLLAAAGSAALQPVQQPGANLTEPLSISTATSDELEMLPGVGPSLAQRIVEDRKVHGRFVSVADLDRVKGVGPALLERMEPYIVP